MARRVGIALGGSRLLAVVCEADGDVVASAEMRTPRSGDRGAVLEVLVACVHEAASQADTTVDQLAGIGVASPGAVVGGTVGQAMNLPGWSERFGLADVLQGELGGAVRVVNDVTAAAVAEHRHGAAADHDHALLVWVADGVGGGIVSGGRIYEGAFGVAGELGHTVVERGGAVCPCGRRGCVEAYAGRRAIEHAVRRAVDAGRATSCFRVAEDLGEDRLTPGVLRQARDEGDRLVADLVDDGADALGKAIASAVNLLDVEAVIIGGPLAEAMGEQFVHQIDASARPNLFLQPPRVAIRSALLGSQAVAIGAALLATDAEG